MATGSSGGASSSKALLFSMTAIFGGMAILLSAGLFIGSRVIRALELSAQSDKRNVHTPIADYRVNQVDQVGPGIPVYPRAALVLPGGDLPAPVLRHDRPQIVSAVYHTNDPRDFVANWYVEHLSSEFTRHGSGTDALPDTLRNAGVAENDIAFLGERGDQVRVIALTEDSTGTKIVLERTTKH